MSTGASEAIADGAAESTPAMIERFAAVFSESGLLKNECPSFETVVMFFFELFIFLHEIGVF